MVDLANELSKKYDVTIFTLYGGGELEGQLYTNVKHKTLYKEKYNNLSNLKKKIIPLKILFIKKHIYKKYIKRDYDVEIAFLEGPITRLFSVKNKKTRKIKLEEIQKSKRTIILYEAPHKLKTTLNDLKDILGNRKIVLARELTKIHEEFIRGNIDEIIEKSENLKGEMILLIEGNNEINNENILGKMFGHFFDN